MSVQLQSITIKVYSILMLVLRYVSYVAHAIQIVCILMCWSLVGGLVKLEGLFVWYSMTVRVCVFCLLIHVSFKITILLF